MPPPLTGIALHQPPWKLIRHADGREDLFHVLEDPTESSPRNASQGVRLQAMSKRIDQYLGGND